MIGKTGTVGNAHLDSCQGLSTSTCTQHMHTGWACVAGMHSRTVSAIRSARVDGVDQL